MNLRVRLAACLLLAAVSLSIHAGDPRPAPPQNGVIDAVHGEEAMVIDDRLFHLSAALRIYDSTGKPLSASALRKGQQVTYHLAPPVSAGYPKITVIILKR